MRIKLNVLPLGLLLCCCFHGFATHAELLVKKQRFEIAEFNTFAGKTIKQVALGYESYGKLNADKSNVVLITHYFSANSHAAGKYALEDAQAGYWDAIIGPGKAIDTNKYFVISIDSLANLNAFDPNTITTGPVSIDPDTGKPYGLTFPVVTIRDFVVSQKLLLESLGISSLYAVIGASMGSLQALDWAAAYPTWVPRMISVIGSGQTDAWTASLLERWAMPIRLDKNWQGGDYYSSVAPKEGLVESMMAITLDALTPTFINQVGQSSEVQHTPLQAQPLHDINASFAIVDWLKERATLRVKHMDANHLLYLVRANQLFVAGYQQNLAAGLQGVTAKTLFLPASSDLLLRPYLAEEAHATLKQQGKQTELIHLDGINGHLVGISNIDQQADTIRQFLAN
jgi:homoserine O-acetyltransferase/O-succinyltransferase